MAPLLVCQDSSSWSSQLLRIEHQTDQEKTGVFWIFLSPLQNKGIRRRLWQQPSALLLDDAREDQDTQYTPHILYPRQGPYPSSHCIFYNQPHHS